MKNVYIILSIFALTSCFYNEKKEDTQDSKHLPPIQTKKQENSIPKILEDSTGSTSSGEPMLEKTENISSGSTGALTKTGSTHVKELEFSITPAPQEVTSPQNDDASITKYVNDQIHYTKINYVPDDLESIAGKYILDTKGNQVLRKEANLYLQELSQAFYEAFGVKLKIVSAYRSYEYQVGIKKRGCSDLFCAKAGYSEHQSGLAFDMFEASSNEAFLAQKDLKKYFEWFQKNAHKYGFHNSYQKGKKIDGYVVEPWHWRYLGVDFAQELFEKGMTYGEYYKIYGQK